MIQGQCRIWSLSIYAVIFLTIYNILLTLKIMYSPECTVNKINYVNPDQNPPLTHCNEDKDHIIDARELNLNLNLGRWDNGLKFKLFDNIIVGSKFVELSRSYSTCLATQGSLERLSSLTEVVDHWTGPISMATFSANDNELSLLLLYISYLRKCSQKIREQINFHIAFPRDKIPKQIKLDIESLRKLDCQNSSGVFKAIVEELKKYMKYSQRRDPYPQNHLRNLARKNCQSKYVFLIDVDIIPSKDMARKLNEFFKVTSCRKKCAYVIPTYELDERVKFPYNKTELIRMSKKGLARPFHYKVFIYNQYATNFTRWQNSLNDVPEVHISHGVTNFEFLYEPFYIATDEVPPHDERFIGYGHTRNSQVYEMYVAGYEFLVLSPIFTCHWGLQSRKMRPFWREVQNNKNRKLFQDFKREIFAKYDSDPLNMMKNRKKG